MSKLSGAEFDRRYASNELAYHKAVNDLVGGTFIPNVETPELKALLEQVIVSPGATSSVSGTNLNCRISTR